MQKSERVEAEEAEEAGTNFEHRLQVDFAAACS